jgi:excisionase family DNA binding protein
MGQLVSVKEAAAMLSVSPSGVRRWIRLGLLPAVKVGSLTRVRVSDLEAFLRPRAQAGGQ